LDDDDAFECFIFVVGLILRVGIFPPLPLPRGPMTIFHKFFDAKARRDGRKTDETYAADAYLLSSKLSDGKNFDFPAKLNI
jgi:hypothetical protein